ncbi:3-deoxy-7-phosphoheptulonate synthase [PVC group bacterium]|nr:3-deoxy-7-phosphoheptulonate synthase [PVC group bacterium]
MTSWNPTSWQKLTTIQQPTYADQEALLESVSALSKLPPLVSSWEIESLKSQLADAANGKRFLLQAGDCAERFADCTPDRVTGQLKVLLQMSLVLVHSTKRRVVRVGRLAGQYAKPRSSDSETIDGVTLPSYRGDLVNDIEFSEIARKPNPNRLLRGFERSAMTINFVRALIDGGFADLHHPEYWDLGFVEHSPRASEYQEIVESIAESLLFMETLAGESVGAINRVEFFTSHEGLHLYYEQAQTRQVPRRDGWYNLSCHFPWIGARTTEIDGGHVEFFRGIANPIGVKIGTHEVDIEKLLATLHPDNEPGRLTLIYRYGENRVSDELPKLIEKVRSTGKQVLFVCDPMHGNTKRTERGIKTRSFDAILSELEQSIDIHKRMGSSLGGVHVEVCGQNVTECTGGARGLDEAGLGDAYETLVDPRLNYEQSIELAMLVGQKLG